jgi:branched-chain amino acid transport system ATP-binding protein
LLKIDNVTCHYGGIRALHEVSLEEKEGEIVALIGGNGAGKTTLLNLISGLVRPTAGKVIFRGKDISALSPEKIVKAGIGQVPEGRLLFGPLTVRENLELGSYVRRNKKNRQAVLDDFEFVLHLFPVLSKRLDQRAGTLSGGEQQMLAIGRGLLAKPALMLLDEPSLGLAPLVVQEIFSVIKRIKSQGATILLVEQNAKAALKVADRAYVIETGMITLQGSADDLLENENVKRAYLGQDSWRK